MHVVLPMLYPCVPAIAFLANLFKKKRIHSMLLYLIACAVGYIVLLVGVWSVDQHLEGEMHSFDLDKDGGIGGDELTPEAQAAMDEWASDTGRSFAPIIGIPMTVIGQHYVSLFCMAVSG